MLPDTWFNIFALAIGSLLTIVFAAQPQILAALDVKINEILPKSVARVGRGASYVRNYADLAAITSALLVLGYFLFNSFQNAITVLEAQKWLSFSSRDGYKYFAVLAGGYIDLPPLLLSLAAHGYRRGVANRGTSIIGVNIGLSIGSIGAAAFIAFVEGRWLLLENSKTVVAANPPAIPLNSKILAIVYSLLLLEFLLFLLSIFTAAVARYGRFVRKRGLSLTGIERS